jgi:hypothetical protein
MEAFSDILDFLAGTPALVGPILTATIIFLTSNWRLSLTALLAQYGLIGLALTRFTRPEVAVVKVLVGVFVVLILYLSARLVQEAKIRQEARQADPRFPGLPVEWTGGPLGFPLRLLAVILVALALVRLFESYQLDLIPANLAFVAVWLWAMGLLGLVLSGEPLRVALSVLTILAGFDLVFSGLELGLAVVGFYGAFTLLAALAFSYLVAVKSLDMSLKEPGETEL